MANRSNPRSITNTAIQSLLVVLLLPSRAQSQNMTVQVTFVPSSDKLLPLCSQQFLGLFEPLLTFWVTKTTKPVIPSFQMPEGISLSYSDPHRRGRMLRADGKGPETRTRLLGTCITCTSSGCFQYCGPATCDRCAGSRRRTADITLRRDEEMSPIDSGEEEERNLSSVDLSDLEAKVSAKVQRFIRKALLSQILDVLGCLGDPYFLTVSVSFLVNDV